MVPVAVAPSSVSLASEKRHASLPARRFPVRDAAPKPEDRGSRVPSHSASVRNEVVSPLRLPSAATSFLSATVPSKCTFNGRPATLSASFAGRSFTISPSDVILASNAIFSLCDRKLPLALTGLASDGA